MDESDHQKQYGQQQQQQQNQQQQQQSQQQQQQHHHHHHHPQQQSTSTNIESQTHVQHQQQQQQQHQQQQQQSQPQSQHQQKSTFTRQYTKDTSPEKNMPTPSLGGVLSAFIPASTNPLAILSSAFRDDSTESDQSLTFSQSQTDAYHRLMCRAPIASLDCMEEFSGTGGHLDFGRSISLGSNPALPIRQTTTITPGLRYKNLGKSGLRISNVGLGTWPLFAPGVNEEMAENVLKVAVESGINLFDLADPTSETVFGKVLHKFSWKRSAFVIVTKIYWSTKSEERGLSRKHIIESVKASLQRLGVDYIDLVIIHKADSMCPMEEIVRAMNYIISQGWAMYWGTARWSPVEIMEAYTNCRQFNCITPIVEQAEYHMFCREKAELYLPEMYNKIGVGLMAWGPLSMALGDMHPSERGLFFSKGSFMKKSHSYSWTEDEVNTKQEFGILATSGGASQITGVPSGLPRVDGMTPASTLKEQRMEEGRRQCDKLRDLSSLADKLGCSPTQLSIAWSLKHEPVQCLLIGATTLEQLHQNLQALQLLPRLSTSVMLELERILDNKPVRPPLISTLALR